jgi:predicted choloylglycine hydrolase
MNNRVTNRIEVNLDQPPEARWNGLRPYADKARELMKSYLADLGGAEQLGSMLPIYKSACVDPALVAELAAVAEMTGLSENEVLVANLYYDAIKFVFGCTAFAVDTRNGPLHARNLDWWTQNGLLSRHTAIIEFYRGAQNELFKSVGWPGFIGTLSGVAPGRFAVTLNAVLSDKAPGLSPPITFMLRSVLEDAEDFDDAVEILSSTAVASDSLLLVTGTERGQMVVIERTPSKGVVRHSEEGYIVVTNDYLEMDAESGKSEVSSSELKTTSCDRYIQAAELLSESLPTTVESCLSVLNDPAVIMDITVQQMVMSAAEGMLEVRIPTSRV